MLLGRAEYLESGVTAHNERTWGVRDSIWPLIVWALPGLLTSVGAIALRLGEHSLLGPVAYSFWTQWFGFYPVTPLGALGFAIIWLRGVRGAPWS